MMKYWVITRILKLERKLGKKFSYEDARKILKLKHKNSAEQLFTDARKIGIVQTKRQVNDLRKVFILINEKKLKDELDKAKGEVLTKIKQLERRGKKYKKILRKLSDECGRKG